MKSDLATRVAAYLDQAQAEILTCLRALVEIETPSADASAQQRLFDRLAAELDGIGYDCRHLPGKDSGGQLYAVPRHCVASAPRQLLLGHGDTVWPTGTIESLPFQIEGPIARGPGIYDMKAGLTQMVFALKALQALEIAPMLTPVLLITSDEEIGSGESQAEIERLAREVERVWVPEPSLGDSGQIKTARKGVGTYRFRVTGRAAHAGIEPESGVSAIVELARLIQLLEALSDRDTGISVTVGRVWGGTAVNVVPAEAEAEVDVRVPTTADARRIDQAIRALQPLRPEVRLSLEGGMERPPLEPTPANRRLWEAARERGRQLGLDLTETSTGGGSDGNFTSAYTATLDGLGAVGGGAHARHEFIYVDRLAERTALLALLLAAPSLG